MGKLVLRIIHFIVVDKGKPVKKRQHAHTAHKYRGRYDARAKQL